MLSYVLGFKVGVEYNVDFIENILNEIFFIGKGGLYRIVDILLLYII